MSSITISLSFALFLIPNLVTAAPQDTPIPISRQEILETLRDSRRNPRQLSQADLVERISERGINFAVDGAILEEFSRAGARSFLIDAIRRAAMTKKVVIPDNRQVLSAGSEVARPSSPAIPTPDSVPTAPPAGSIGYPDPEARQAALARLPFIEQARYKALEYTDELPNFRVTQFVTRFARGPADRDWVKRDTLELDLTYSARGGEKYSLIRLNGAPTKIGYEQVAGSTSSGEFGALLSSLFAYQAKTEFNQTGTEKFNGRESKVFDFRVRKANSNSELSDRTSGRSVVAGYRGTVWIDIETKAVLRIELAHENIQPGFPITLAENSVDYDWVLIAGQRYLLPVRAEVLLGRDADREYSRNEIQFRQYQKFDTDVKLVPEDHL